MSSSFFTSFQTKMPAASSLFSTYASISALLMLVRSIFHEFIPKSVRLYLRNLLDRYLFKPRSTKLTLVIEDSNPSGLGRNEVYDAAELYLSTKITTPSTDRLKISKSPKDKTLTIRFEEGEKINDVFNGVSLQWRFSSRDAPKRPDDDSPPHVSSEQVNFFELSFDKDQKDNVINNYIPYILSRSNLLQDENRTLKLCTLTWHGHAYWISTNFVHPSTFDTLAMDPHVKSAIKADLDRFVGRKEFYKRVGKAWKRGYLLYGPPGTGKSSLIAAIANYMKFDVYDLQIGNTIKDSDLRRLLLDTPNRSIIVIEDIDCTVDIKNRNNHEGGSNDDDGEGSENNQKPHNVQVTLSGLLNFVDGLWSSCGDERIIIFTTNHKEMLDPALLRPGRMDMHIHMSYLTVPGFRQLASNYLEIDGCSHPLSGKIEGLIETINVTPAQVAEELMRSENADEALGGVTKLLMKMVNKEPFRDGVENGHSEG